MPTTLTDPPTCITTTHHDTAVRSARERLAPVRAARLREPPPTDEEIARGLGRLPGGIAAGVAEDDPNRA